MDLLLTFAEDMRVILIMIADRVNIMRQIKDCKNDEARRQVANEAAYLYAPLAHKLGLYKLKSELEDLSLKYTEKEVYYHIKEKLNENDTHVLSESQQQVAEILGLDGRTFGIKFVYTYQSPDDACHILAIDLLHFQSGASAAAHGVVQHEPQDRSTLHSDFFRYNDSRLHIFDDGIQTEYITLDTVVLYSIVKKMKKKLTFEA